MLLSLLQLPYACRVEHKIPKKNIAEHARHSSSAARLLQQAVESIHLLGHITPNNSNIAAYQDAEHEYLELMLISVRLKEPLPAAGQLKQLHQLLHQSIAYPLLLELRNERGAQWSLAEKTINQASPEHEQLVVQELVVTDWQSEQPNELQKEFQHSLRFDQLDHASLKTLYLSLLGCFVRYLTAHSLQQTTLADAAARYDQNLEQQHATLRKIQQLQQHIKTLQAQRDSCSQFNEKVAINLELQRLTRELKELS